MQEGIVFHRNRLTFFASTILLSLSMMTGCHHKDTAPPPPPIGPSIDNSPAPSATLTADPPAVELGQSVVLNWRTQNATSVTIDGLGPEALNGTQTVTPSNSTNFHLVAKNDAGQTTEANVRVTVREARPPAPMGGEDTGPDAESRAFHQNVQDAFFDYDSYELRPDAAAATAHAAAYIIAHPDIKVLVAGYSDERGSAEYNLALGENRANAAKTALVNAGVSPTRIRVVSYGKEKQFCTEANETCWQENRRAQFSVDR
jgi:peptidoglycan-associated lipoprotein